jgi:hypothetical protein
MLDQQNPCTARTVGMFLFESLLNSKCYWEWNNGTDLCINFHIIDSVVHLTAYIQLVYGTITIFELKL